MKKIIKLLFSLTLISAVSIAIGIYLGKQDQSNPITIITKSDNAIKSEGENDDNIITISSAKDDLSTDQGFFSSSNVNTSEQDTNTETLQEDSSISKTSVAQEVVNQSTLAEDNFKKEDEVTNSSQDSDNTPSKTNSSLNQEDKNDDNISKEVVTSNSDESSKDTDSGISTNQDKKEVNNTDEATTPTSEEVALTTIKEAIINGISHNYYKYFLDGISLVISEEIIALIQSKISTLDEEKLKEIYNQGIYDQELLSEEGATMDEEEKEAMHNMLIEEFTSYLDNLNDSFEEGMCFDDYTYDQLIEEYGEPVISRVYAPKNSPDTYSGDLFYLNKIVCEGEALYYLKEKIPVSGYHIVIKNNLVWDYTYCTSLTNEQLKIDVSDL